MQLRLSKFKELLSRNLLLETRFIVGMEKRPLIGLMGVFSYWVFISFDPLWLVTSRREGRRLPGVNP